MRYLYQTFAGLFIAAGMGLLLTSCGGGGNNSGQTAAVGTCAAGQVYTSANACGVVTAGCSGGLVNNQCYPASTPNGNTTGAVAGYGWLNGQCVYLSNGIQGPVSYCGTNTGSNGWNGNSCTNGNGQVVPVGQPGCLGSQQPGFYIGATGVIMPNTFGAGSSLNYTAPYNYYNQYPNYAQQAGLQIGATFTW